MVRNEAGNTTRLASLVPLLALAVILLLVGCAGSTPAATSAGQSTQAQQPAPTTAPPSAAKTSAPAAPTSAPAAKAPMAAAVSIEACSLLTTDEVQAVVGQAVRAQPDVSDPTAVGCSYFGVSETDKSRLASYAVYPLSPTQAKGVHEATKGGGRDQVTVPGLGDDAYWDSMAGLNVLKGRYAVLLGVNAQAEKKIDRLEASKTLAPKLLARLP